MTAFEYTLPAVRGKQAGRDYFVTMCPLALLSQLFADQEESLRPDLAIHRSVNTQRLPEMVRYVADHPKSYVFSALTASVNSRVKFDCSVANEASAATGILRIPMSAHLTLHDGLHRCAALKRAVKRNPKLADECVCVVIYPDPGRRRAEQIFTDLKRHERKSSRSLSILHDDRDDLARLTRQMIPNVEVFADSIEMSRTTISNRSRKLFTLNALYQATKTLLSNQKSEDFAVRLRIATDFWNEVAKRIPDWSRAVKGEMTPAALRKSFVHAHGLALAALGRTGQTLLKCHPKTWRQKLGRLKSLDWSRDNAPLWEGRAMIGGRLSKANSCIVLTGNAIKQHLRLPLSSEEEALERQHIGGK